METSVIQTDIQTVDNSTVNGDSEKHLLQKKNKFKETLFLTSVTGLSAVVAFGSTLALARKKDPTFFNKGVAGSKDMQETGAELALRALKYGTLYAVAGCGLISYGIWKLSGASNFEEFRTKMGELLPRISSTNPPQGRTEFEGFKDLFHYLSTEYSSNNTKK